MTLAAGLGGAIWMQHGRPARDSRGAFDRDEVGAA